MSRWIDADDFKAFLGEVRARYNLFSDEERPHYEAYSKALYILNEYLEDALLLDLVRCGECKYWGNSYICWRRRAKPIAMNPDDFCSYGERQESE